MIPGNRINFEVLLGDSDKNNSVFFIGHGVAGFVCLDKGNWLGSYVTYDDPIDDPIIDSETIKLLADSLNDSLHTQYPKNYNQIVLK